MDTVIHFPAAFEKSVLRIPSFPATKSTKASHEAQEHFANSERCLNGGSVLGMLDVLIDSCMNSHEPELIRNKYDSILTTPIRRRLWNAISAPPQE